VIGFNKNMHTFAEVAMQMPRGESCFELSRNRSTIAALIACWEN